MNRNRLLLAIVLSVLLCFSPVLLGKADTIMYDETYGGINRDRAFSLVEASDGGYALAGATNSLGIGGFDGWLVKTDPDGNMEWNKTYGGAGDDVVSSMVITSDGGYALAGKWNCDGFLFWIDKQVFDGFIFSDGDAWLIKTDSSGNMEWNKTYEGRGGSGAYSLVAASDGGYALAGCTRSANSSFYTDAWLIKTDSSGNMEWNKTYGGPSLDGFFSLIVTSDGGYTMAGYTDPSSANDMDFWLVKTDELGNMEWNMTYDGAGWDEAYSLVETSDGGFAIAGTTGTYDPIGSGDFWLVKTDGAGNAQWNQTYGGAGQDFANSLVETSDGGFAMAGYWDYYYTGSMLDLGPPYHGDVWLVKTDEFGNMKWSQRYGGSDFDGAYSLVGTSDGGFAIAGYTYVTFSLGSDGDDDVWLLKTDENGVVPEAAWIVLPLLLVATVSILFCKKKMLFQSS